MSLFSKKSKTMVKHTKYDKEGQKAYQLKKFAEATLGSGNLRAAVVLPEGEDLNEWLAVHSMRAFLEFPFSFYLNQLLIAVDFFNQINMLYGTITEFCTPQDCEVMSAGPRYEYHWADEKTKVLSFRVSCLFPVTLCLFRKQRDCLLLSMLMS